MLRKELPLYRLLAIQVITELILAGFPIPTVSAASLCTSDPECSEQWHLGEQGTEWLNLHNRVKEHSIDLSPVTVAILDSGIKLDHPDFHKISDASCGVIGQYGEPLECETVADESGHGTQVAGQIFATSDNEVGGAGVLPELIKEAIIVKVMLPSGVVNYSDMYTGLDYLLSLVKENKKIDVVVLSIAGDPLATVSSVEQNLIEKIKVQLTDLADAGVIIVAGAGNDPGEPTHFPANQPGVIDVGASTETGEKTLFSSSGNKVDSTWQMLAPGINIGTTCLETEFCLSNGTSLSTPQVAQAAAIIKSVYPDADVKKVREILYKASTQSISSDSTGLEYRILNFNILADELGIPELTEQKFMTWLPAVISSESTE